jgi:taurine dioxygenase
MKIHRLAGAFGVEVHEVDVASLQSEQQLQPLLALLFEHRVLVIRRQSLSKAQFAHFGRHWGDPLPFFIESHRDPEQPELIRISNSASIPPSQRGGAAHWHTDSSYETVPASVTMLYCIESPRHGGETWFADMAAAYDALSEADQCLIDGLQVRHAVKGGQALAMQGEKLGAAGHAEEVQRQLQKEMPMHPLVRVHPITGRKALYAISGTACGIDGMAQDAAIELLARLKTHAVQPQFLQTQCKAEQGDLLLWDNLATLHSASPLEYSDEDGKRRLLYRISTTGLPSVYQTAGALAG